MACLYGDCMFDVNITSKTTKDELSALAKIVKDIQNLEVYIGIPEENSTREKSGEINNAELAYIHTHGIRSAEMRNEMDKSVDSGMPYSKAHALYIQSNGSPLWQSPPRPIIEPAIEHFKGIIAEELGKAATVALDGDKEKAIRQLKHTGMIGQNIVRDWFTNPDNNWPPNSEATIKRKGSDRPLIDTGELRKSITYVVGDKK